MGLIGLDERWKDGTFIYEYMFQMWRIDPYALCIRILNHIWNIYSYNRIWEMWRTDPYALCIRILNHIWNMYSYNRIWEIAVNTKSAMANPNRAEGHIFECEWIVILRAKIWTFSKDLVERSIFIDYRRATLKSFKGRMRVGLGWSKFFLINQACPNVKSGGSCRSSS